MNLILYLLIVTCLVITCNANDQVDPHGGRNLGGKWGIMDKLTGRHSGTPATTVVQQTVNQNTMVDNSKLSIEAETANINMGGESNDKLSVALIKLLKTLQRARQEFNLTPSQYTDLQGSNLKQLKNSKILWNPETRLLIDPSSKLPLKLLEDLDLLQVINEDPGVEEILKEEAK